MKKMRQENNNLGEQVKKKTRIAFNRLVVDIG